jgi:uncharacterized protein
MGTLTTYVLPIQGLKVGIHQFEYTLDQTFFSHFEDSPIQECSIVVQVELDKRSDMLVFEFVIDGWIKAECDRCTADIQLPLESEQMLYVKYSEEEQEDLDEVVFISYDAPQFNLAPYLYEFAVLSLPITNTYDCENDTPLPCNTDVLKVLKQNQQDDNSGSDDSDSIWGALKDFKN